MHKRILIVFTSLLLAFSAARAQVNIDAYRDYFLVGQFGEVCTMCEIIVLCEKGNAVPAYEGIPESGSFVLYHLQTRTFWSQMGTIWEWFIANFTADELAAQGHTRPVEVYQVSDGVWSGLEMREARLRLDPGTLDFGADVIDRVDSAWSPEGVEAPIGYCQRLPLWDALVTIDASTGASS